MSVPVPGAMLAGSPSLVRVLLRIGRRFVVRSKRRPRLAPFDTAPVDADRVAAVLGRTIRHQTISWSREVPPSVEAFEALHAELRTLFPRVHASLECERVGGLSLMYTLRGSDPELEPIVLAAHQDVVPVDPGTEDAWKHAPFSGAVSDGEVWGRGALDDKGSLVASMAAVEDLLTEGFVPRRTLILAFGHDEEIEGEAGAKAVAMELKARGVRAAMVLDEGGAISDGLLPGLGPVALVGVAEKGSVSLELTADGDGGHSSMPPPQSAIGTVSQAVRALETKRPRARMVGVTRGTLEALAPALPLPSRFVLANVGLFERLLLRLFATRPALDAAIRTTTAATMIHSGAKPNVLPTRATAVVNFRILPGESVDDVVAHAGATIADERVRIEIAPGTSAREPSGTSPVIGPVYALLEETIVARFPDVTVAPYLVLGRTDGRHYEVISDHVYRFLPLRLDAEARLRLHGTDERVGVEDLAGAVAFYRELIRRAQRDLESSSSDETHAWAIAAK